MLPKDVTVVACDVLKLQDESGDAAQKNVLRLFSRSPVHNFTSELISVIEMYKHIDALNSVV